ncbi:MAG: ABC transporter permease [Deinococcales bacterium]
MRFGWRGLEPPLRPPRLPLALLASLNQGGLLSYSLKRLADIWQAVPYPITALALAAIISPSLLSVIIILALSTWVLFFRVVFQQSLVIQESDYILAAKALGARPRRLLTRHILPQMMPQVIVLASVLASSFIVFEASLSFLGIGLPSQMVSWGTMAADGRGYEALAWWLAILPGLAIVLSALAIHLLGESLKKYFMNHG